MSAVHAPEPDREGGTPSRRTHAVFISDFLHVSVPFAQLAVVLLDKDAAWLRRLEVASCAPIDGGKHVDPSGVAAVTMRIGPDGRARQSVIVTAGKARLHQRAVIVPITWEPVGFRRLLPTLDADLELSELDDSTSRLAINGRYRVPLGQVGLSLDNVAMHRLAEASMRSFLHELDKALVLAR
jgi:hypothetical protein